ncbi:ferritin-like domain-containing protein [Candidatus Hecatella orcuttiae]|jgi:bacterioferritin|uniref:ferritin-like domain-containing protein n=1 Tax=Candidatus Hecatella orcuttiae TaxID=1935119 RepID=UPI002867E4EE|nr:ferritin-like domain-containing protein [Candidatus Hecatella orcuttiae]
MGKTSRVIADLDVDALIEELNRAIADEWLAIAQYWYGSLAPEQTMNPVVKEAIKKALDDEREHVNELAERILELGGTPLKNPDQWNQLAHCKYLEPPNKLTDLRKFLQDALKGEECAMKAYNEIAKLTFGKDHITYQLIVHILSEEAEHEEMFEDMLENLPCDFK